MTFTDRWLLVLCWLMDSVVGLISLGLTVTVISVNIPVPFNVILAFILYIGAITLLAASAGRAVGMEERGQQIIISNLFRTMELERSDILRVKDGFWASAVHQVGDIGYLVLRQRVRTFVFPRTRVPVHATFRWRGEPRREAAKAELARLAGQPIRWP